MHISRNKSLWALLFILLLGLLLRMYDLSTKSLWYDETSSILNALKDFNFISQPIYNYKPLYIFLLKAWIAVFGIGAFASRFLSVLFGVFSILLVFQIGKYTVGTKVGLLSSFLLSISCFHIYHSQQVRLYTFLVFLTLCSFFYLVRFLSEKKTKYILLNIVLNSAIVCTHPYGLSVILAQFFYMIFSGLYQKKEFALRKLIIFQFPILLLLGILVPVILRFHHHIQAILWWAKLPGLHDLIETFKTFCYGGPRYGLSDVRVETCPLIIAQILTFMFALLFTKGLTAIINKKTSIRLKDFGALFIIWLSFPIGSAFLFSYIFFPVYFIKLLMTALPAFYLIIAIGVCDIRNLYVKATAVLIISLLNIVPLKIMYGTNVNLKWDKVVSFIAHAHSDDNATIIISTTKEIIPFMYYFTDADKNELKNIDMFGKFINNKWQNVFEYQNHRVITLGNEAYDDKEKTADYIITRDFEKSVWPDYLLNSNKQIWLLVSSWSGEEYFRESLARKMMTHFDLKIKKEITGIRAYCFEPK